MNINNFDLYKPTDMLGQSIKRNSIIVASTSGQSVDKPGIWIVRDVSYETYNNWNGVITEYLKLVVEKITITSEKVDKVRKSQSDFRAYKDQIKNNYYNFHLIVLTGETERLIRDSMIKWLVDNKKDARDYV